MSELRREELVNLRNDLLTAMTIAEERRDRGKANEQKKNSYEVRVVQIQKDIDELTACASHLRDVYKNIEHYNKEHSEKSKSILDLAIVEAGNLVPDADVEGVHLHYTDDKRVFVVNSKNQNINIREGCGYRAILGALIRYAALKAQPDAFPLLLFDEYFFTLSDVTTAQMKLILEAMKKDVTIICIEQRRNAVDGIVDSEYTFKKGDDKVITVTKTL